MLGWLLLVAQPVVDLLPLLRQAQATLGPDTEAKAADPRVTALEAQNQQLLQIIADQARAGLKTVAGADTEAGVRVEQERVKGALARAAKGERGEALAILGEVAASRAARAEQASREATAGRKEAAETYRQLGALAFLSSTGQAVGAYRRAAELDPDNSWTWIFLSRLEAQAGRLAVAEEAARRARDAATRARQDRDIMAADTELGDVRVAQGKLAEALSAFQQAKSVAERLAGSDPGNADWQRDLSVSWNKLGDVRVAQGDLVGALQAFEATHAIVERLAGSDPGNAQWQRDLSISWERLASVREREGDRVGAQKAWRAALTISEPLATRFPDHIPIRTTPVIHLAGLARTLDPSGAGTAAEARRLYDRALGLLQPLAEAGLLDAQRKGWIRSLERQQAAFPPR